MIRMACSDEIVSSGTSCRLIRAHSSRADELAAVTESSAAAHAPWTYHGSVESYFRKIENGRTIGFFVVDAIDDALACVINLNEPVGGGFSNAFLGYFTAAGKMRKGLMLEGLALTLEYAFTLLSFHRLEANIQPGNEPSISLAQKLGFRYEGFSPAYLKIGGEWRDHNRYAILAEEWETSALRRDLVIKSADEA